MYVVLTPILALALFRIRIGVAGWSGVLLATVGLAMLAGIHGGSPSGDLLVLGGAAVYSLQIVLLERFAPFYDALGFTLVEMLAAFAVLVVAAIPRSGGAARVDGVGSAARDRRLCERARLPRADLGAARSSATRTALVFALEPVWAAIFGFALAGDRLGALGFGGCAVIMAGIVLAEPAAAGVLVRGLRGPSQ